MYAFKREMKRITGSNYLANRREAPHYTVGQCRDERRFNNWGSMPQLLKKK